MSEFGSSTEGATSKRKTVVIVSVVVPITTAVILAVVTDTDSCLYHRTSQKTQKIDFYQHKLRR